MGELPLAKGRHAWVQIARGKAKVGGRELKSGDGAALSDAKGGPFRLLVPGHADECVHVKQVAKIELSERMARDTRPKDDAEHAKLHKKK